MKANASTAKTRLDHKKESPAAIRKASLYLVLHRFLLLLPMLLLLFFGLSLPVAAALILYYLLFGFGPLAQFFWRKNRRDTAYLFCRMTLPPLLLPYPRAMFLLTASYVSVSPNRDLHEPLKYAEAINPEGLLLNANRVLLYLQLTSLYFDLARYEAAKKALALAVATPHSEAVEQRILHLQKRLKSLPKADRS